MAEQEDIYFHIYWSLTHVYNYADLQQLHFTFIEFCLRVINKCKVFSTYLLPRQKSVQLHIHVQRGMSIINPRRIKPAPQEDTQQPVINKEDISVPLLLFSNSEQPAIFTVVAGYSHQLPAASCPLLMTDLTRLPVHNFISVSMIIIHIITIIDHIS